MINKKIKFFVFTIFIVILKINNVEAVRVLKIYKSESSIHLKRNFSSAAAKINKKTVINKLEATKFSQICKSSNPICLKRNFSSAAAKINKKTVINKLEATKFSQICKSSNPICLKRNFSSTSLSHTTPTTDKTEKKTVRILSIDGGGIRGVIPLTILSHIEKETRKPICQLFDIISGTSTGGIIALGLNSSDLEKRKASNIKSLYDERNEEIFHQDRIYRTFPILSKAANFFWPKYSNESLKKLLESEFQTQLLSQSASTVIIPAYDIQSSKIHVFSSDQKSTNREDFYMKDVALATSAAPTYFSPAKISPSKHDDKFPKDYKYSSEKYYLIDGGVTANNPTLLAYSHAKDLFPAANDFLIVSLGTGTRTVGFTRYDELKESANFLEWIKNGFKGGFKGGGFWGWARKLPGLMINASSSANEYYLDVFLKEFKHISTNKHRYFRFQPELPEELAALDSTRKDKISDLIDHGNRMIQKEPYKSHFEVIIDELKSERSYVDKRHSILIPGVHLSQVNVEMVDTDDIYKRIREEILTDHKTSRQYYTKKDADKILKKIRTALVDNPQDEITRKH